ncbi:MAG: ATP-binding protein, partial [Anaerolineaceae bacterium]|nr:ATP-binding protein [Anaerolineaceae bacterium]
MGFSSKETYAIQMAVDEACSNIIDHAYGAEDLGYIEVQIDKLKTSIKITITDDGKPFDPAAVPIPDLNSPLELRKERGLGVFFMRKLMDKVDYDFSNRNQNKLVMIKKKQQKVSHKYI